MDLTTVKTVGIIGAGEAGLATAKMLLGEGIRCTVFERNSRVGGVWTGGYLEFGTQVQRELYEIPDWPLPKNISDFTPGPVVCQYLQDYADHFGVSPHIRLNTTVTSVDERAGNKPGWSLTYESADGVTRQEDFDLVVVAIGVYSQAPHTPRFPGQEQFQGQVIHNSKLQSREQLKDRKVLTVGYGKSATDAAILGADHADESTIVFREPHWPVPATLMGFLPFKYALFTRLNCAMLTEHVRASKLMKAWHKLGKPAIWAYWRMVEKLLTSQCGLDRPRRGKSATQADLMPAHSIEYDGFGNSTMLPKPEFFDYIHTGKLGAERASITRFTETGVQLSNGNEVTCDLVVLATGWRSDYGFLADQIQQRIGFNDDGYYLYRQMLHPGLPNLAFIGSNAATYINILTHNLQARWLTELIRGTHKLPEDIKMLDEIEETKQWKREIIPPSRARSATLHLHMQHYHDELLKDMGLPRWRKRGLFKYVKELLAPYQPSDYASVCSGVAIRAPKPTVPIRSSEQSKSGMRLIGAEI